MNFFKKTTIIPVLLFIFVFGLYVYTSPRVDSNYADSDEMITASYIIGLPHPPGYPLYLILGKLFSYLPFGEIAFRYSVFTAFFGALTVMLVYLIIVRILSWKKDENLIFAVEDFNQIENSKSGRDLDIYIILPALTGALSLAFSYLFWLYSIVPEVFSLHNFFIALLIYISVVWYQASRKNIAEGLDRKIEDKYLFFFALFAVLAFLSHQISIILVPAFVYLIYFIDKTLLAPSKRWFKLAFGFLSGLLPLIYFPLASKGEPAINFGNVVSLKALWDYASRKLYADFSASGSAYLPSAFNLKEKIAETPYYFYDLAGYFGAPLLILGFFAFLCILFFSFLQRRKDSHQEIFIFLAFLFSGPLLAIYISVDRKNTLEYSFLGTNERMYIMGSVIFGILIGLGAKIFLEFIKKINLKAPLAIFAALLLLLPAFPLKNNFKYVNKNNFYLGEDAGYNIFVNMEPNAIYFVRGDRTTFAAYYWKYVKGLRQDVTIIPFGLTEWALKGVHKKEPNLWDTDSKEFMQIIRDIVRDNIDKRPIYFSSIPTTSAIELGVWGDPYILSPRGIIFQVTKKFDPREEEDFWGNMRWLGSKNIDDYKDWFAKEIFEIYVISSYNSLVYYDKNGYYDLVKREAERLATIDPYHRNFKYGIEMCRADCAKKREVKTIFLKTGKEYFDLGQKYIKEGQPTLAMAEFWMAKELDPKNAVFRFNLAKTYELFKWNEDALKEYREILKIDPSNRRVKEKITAVEYLLNNN